MLHSTKVILLVVSAAVGILSCADDNSTDSGPASAGAQSDSGAAAGGYSSGTGATQSVGGGVAPGDGGQAGLGGRGSGGLGGASAIGAAGNASCENFVNPMECCSAPDHLPCRAAAWPRPTAHSANTVRPCEEFPTIQQRPAKGELMNRPTSVVTPFAWACRKWNRAPTTRAHQPNAFGSPTTPYQTVGLESRARPTT
jgi:hypothetical protein